jgi:glycerophosphoryl diester phosphodiesterase
MTARRFIAHRGVHLGSTVSGENSLEAVGLARRAGFACIETDVHLTSDGVFVVMHDETLNRTATYTDGTPLERPIRVDEVTLASLRADFRLTARDAANRTRIPTLEEYLRACADAGLLPFIEVKLRDQPEDFSRRLLQLADSVLGRGGYVITSNGETNRAIRALGIHDVPMMDILYQAPSFDDVTALGNVIVAISATRYARDEHRALTDRARREGFVTEVHADDAAGFEIAETHGIDLISTDLLAPDLSDAALIVRTAELGHGELEQRDAHLALPTPPHLAFGGMYLDIALTGSCEVQLGPQRFTLTSAMPRRFRHQVLVFDAPAEFTVTMAADSRVAAARLTVAEF